MKGDFSRYTFNKNKHYNGVLMQQGRVQLDADWNEQQAIDRYRTESQGMDVIGPCGAPRDNPGFKITSPGESQLNIGKGHYYVDGILVENENPVVYDRQPDFPTPPNIRDLLRINGAKVGSVYLDVWQRHITSLDNPYLREKALGGPDTTTRLKTIWQVKILPLPSVKIDKPADLAERILKWQELEAKLIELRGRGEREAIEGTRSEQIKVEYEIMKLAPRLLCGGEFEKWSDETAPSTGKLNAHTVKSNKDEGPCLLPPLAGYKRLENQLYRVEIHTGGPRNEATFKWSRDNASVVTRIKEINEKDITVFDVGKDEVLGFANDQWVEIKDDKTELSGNSGQLIQIANVNSATKVIKLKEKPTAVDMALHPKLRRWDHVDQSGASVMGDGIGMGAEDVWLPLEDGIEVQFSDGNYQTGDYWLVPGRTATGEIEWPPYQVPNTDPIAQPPLGIKHHFCRLALFFAHSRKFYVFEDCRRLFPPVTELTNLFYISGDGQEAMPGDDLPQPIVVGVSNGQWPVAGATVRLKIKNGGGQLIGLGPNDCVLTGADGIARCRWKLGNTMRSQQVEATLLGSGGKTLHIPIIFTANLSTADQVAYDPKGCTKLSGDNNVQLALERLSNLTKISYYAGDGQEAQPGHGLPQLLQVSVANKCGPVNGARVRFTTEDGGFVTRSLNQLSGATSNTVVVNTRAGGIASCAWKLNEDPTKKSQQLEATLMQRPGEEGDKNIQLPKTVVFTANQSRADEVAYDPTNCSKLRGMNTVQAAIDELCRRGNGGGCAVSVGEKGGQHTNLRKALDELLKEQTDICICLLPGEHNLPDGLEIAAPRGNVNLKIIGCGPGTRVRLKKPWRVDALSSFVLRDVTVIFDQVQDMTMQFAQCREVALESCALAGITKERMLLSIVGADIVRLKDNVINAYQQTGLNRSNDVFKDVSSEHKGLFKILNPKEFNLGANMLAKELSKLSLAKRTPIARKIENSVSGLGDRLSVAEKKGYAGFVSALTARSVNMKSLAVGIRNIRKVTHTTLPGKAVVIMDGSAEVMFENNDISGVVSFYGQPGNTRLSVEELKSLGEYLKSGSIVVLGSTGKLCARNNKFTCLFVANGLIQKIKRMLSSRNPKGQISGVFGYISLDDNLIEAGRNQFISRHLAMMSNLFVVREKKVVGRLTVAALPAPAIAGTIVTDSVVFVGNQATNPARLYCTSRVPPEPTANVAVALTGS